MNGPKRLILGLASAALLVGSLTWGAQPVHAEPVFMSCTPQSIVGQYPPLPGQDVTMIHGGTVVCSDPLPDITVWAVLQRAVEGGWFTVTESGRVPCPEHPCSGNKVTDWWLGAHLGETFQSVFYMELISDTVPPEDGGWRWQPPEPGDPCRIKDPPNNQVMECWYESYPWTVASTTTPQTSVRTYPPQVFGMVK